MGFRLGWFGKRWVGITWGPRGGFRFYLRFGGHGGKSGCLVPFVLLVIAVPLP